MGNTTAPRTAGQICYNLAWRGLRVFLIAYLVVLLVMMVFENSLIFFPTKYPEGNWEPWGITWEDASFAAADGTQSTVGTFRTSGPGGDPLLPRQRGQRHASRPRHRRAARPRGRRDPGFRLPRLWQERRQTGRSRRFGRCPRGPHVASERPAWTRAASCSWASRWAGPWRWTWRPTAPGR